MSGSGAILEPLLGPDHLATLVLVRAHLSVAFHLHRLDLTGLSSGAIHDACPDLIADPDAVPALTGRAEPQLHLLTLTGPDGEMIEFTLVLGRLLLLDLDHFSPHLLGTLLSREGEGGAEDCQDHQGHGLLCSFHWVVPPHSHSESVVWFLFDAHRKGVKQSSCQIRGVL